MAAEATENRSSHRKTTYNGGEIGYGGKKVGCIVRDLSPKGARIEVKFGTPALPDRFDLTIPGVLAKGCRVIWREGRELGVKFG